MYVLFLLYFWNITLILLYLQLMHVYKPIMLMFFSVLVNIQYLGKFCAIQKLDGSEKPLWSNSVPIVLCCVIDWYLANLIVTAALMKVMIIFIQGQHNNTIYGTIGMWNGYQMIPMLILIAQTHKNIIKGSDITLTHTQVSILRDSLIDCCCYARY